MQAAFVSGISPELPNCPLRLNFQPLIAGKMQVTSFPASVSLKSGDWHPIIEIPCAAGS
jgi:hypothetical protein